jgi:hypothetical protein
MPRNRAIIADRRCDNMYAQTTVGVSTNTVASTQRRPRRSQRPKRNTNIAFMWIVAECSERLSKASRAGPLSFW